MRFPAVTRYGCLVADGLIHFTNLSPDQREDPIVAACWGKKTQTLLLSYTFIVESFGLVGGGWFWSSENDMTGCRYLLSGFDGFDRRVSQSDQ